VGVKTYKPITPGMRQRVSLDFSELTKGVKPEKSLIVGLTKKSGRSRGRISIRHKGGGHKRRYRIIDFKRDKIDISGIVTSIEYDPNRSANIALVSYKDGEKRYIIAPKGLKQGDMVMSGPSAPMETGNALPLENIPLGFTVYNIELTNLRWARVDKWHVLLVLEPLSLPKAVTTLLLNCLLVKHVWYLKNAMLLSEQ